jgi:hypothetical protein
MLSCRFLKVQGRNTGKVQGRNTGKVQGKDPLKAIKEKSKELNNNKESTFGNTSSKLLSFKDFLNRAIETGTPFLKLIEDYNNLQKIGIIIYQLKKRFETGNLYGTLATLEAEFHKILEEYNLKKQKSESNFNQKFLNYEVNNVLHRANIIFKNIRGSTTEDTLSFVKVVDKSESDDEPLIDELMNNSDNPEFLSKKIVNKTVLLKRIYVDNTDCPFTPKIGSMTDEELFSLIKEICDIIESDLKPETTYDAFFDFLYENNIVSSKKEYKELVNLMKTISKEAPDIFKLLSDKDYINIDVSQLTTASAAKLDKALSNRDMYGNPRRDDKNAIALAENFKSWRKIAKIGKFVNLSDFIRRYIASNVSKEEKIILKEQMRQFIEALRLLIEEFPQSVTVFMHLNNHTVSKGRVSGITPSNEMCAFIALLHQFMEVNIFDNKYMRVIFSFFEDFIALRLNYYDVMPKSEVDDLFGDTFNKISCFMDQYKYTTMASSFQQFILNSILEKKYVLDSNGKINFPPLMFVTDLIDCTYEQLQKICDDLVSSFCKGYVCNPLFIVLYRCGELQTKPFCEDGNTNVFECTGYSTITFKTLLKSIVHKSTDGIVLPNASVVNIDVKEDEAVEEDEEYDENEYDEEERCNSNFSTFSEVLETKTSKLLIECMESFFRK